MSAHTPEPWRIVPSGDFALSCSYSVANQEHEPIADHLDRADAARTVACVNACKGMDDPASEIAALKARLVARMSIYQSQRDDLLAALIDVDESIGLLTETPGLAAMRLAVRAAIAKVQPQHRTFSDALLSGVPELRDRELRYSAQEGASAVSEEACNADRGDEA